MIHLTQDSSITADQHFESRCTIYSYFDFSLKNSFRLPYQRLSSSADCTKELFNGSNGSASLVDCTWKKIFWLGVWIFCEWRHKWSSFRVILAHAAWLKAQPLGQSVSLKFSLETRLESESFEPLIDFLAFLVQKLWSKINKWINWLISQKFLLTYITTFEPETPPEKEYYIIEQFIGTIVEWSECCAMCTTWCSRCWKTAHRKDQYRHREFAIINQRPSSNLGFRML